MGYFKGLTDGIFKKDKSGNTIFYPYGILGSGYVIKSKDQVEQVRSYVYGVTILGFGGLIAAKSLFGFKGSLLCLLVFGVGYALLVHEITKDLEKSAESLKLTEAMQTSAQSIGIGYILFFFVCSVVLTIGGFLLLPIRPLLGVICIVLYGFCAAFFLYMLSSLK